MKKKDKLYLGTVVLLSLIYISYRTFGLQPVDWSPSFSGSDKIPYGAFILDKELELLFPNQQINRLSIPPFDYLRNAEIADERLNWIFINNRIDFEPNELELLLNRVESGDQLFVSASAIGNLLSDSLGFSIDYTTSLQNSIQNSDEENGQNSAKSVNLNLLNPKLETDEGWNYETRRFAYFSEIDTNRAVILGDAGAKRANFIKINRGAGAVTVHLLPKAFTNYYVRDEYYAMYSFSALSYLPVQNVIWDEYYKAGRKEYTTPLGYILNIPSLRNAWFLALSGVVFFMVFRGRRKQRSIPVREKPENSTLAFARTIGSLYLEKGTHRAILEKKIRFFKDYCRRKLGIELVIQDADAEQSLANRSGISHSKITDLLERIRKVENSEQVGKEILEQVSSKIDQFYKDSRR